MKKWFLKFRKKDKSKKVSPLYQSHEALELLIPALDKSLDELWRSISLGNMSSCAEDKMRAFARLTAEVKDVAVAYNNVLKEYFNISEELLGEERDKRD